MAAKMAMSLMDGRLAVSRIPKSRYDQVIQFMGLHFFPNEVMNKAINFYTGEHVKLKVGEILKSELEQDMSVMVVDRSTNDLVGSLIACSTSPQQKDQVHQLIRDLTVSSRQWRALATLMNAAYPETIFETCGTEHIFELHQMTLLPAYQDQKLAKPIVRMVSDLGWHSGFSVQHGFGTREASNGLLKPLGFQVHRQVFVKDVLFEGKPLTEQFPFLPDANVRVMFCRRPDGNLGLQ